jgi:hypothetical protein
MSANWRPTRQNQHGWNQPTYRGSKAKRVPSFVAYEVLHEKLIADGVNA